MPKITCYGDVGKIGGSKILLEDKGFRIFFNFERAFGRYDDYFKEASILIV